VISVNFGNKGANQVYDFSSLHNYKLDSLYYLAPTATQRSNVPNANLAVTADHNTYLLGQDTTLYFAFDGLQTVAFGNTVISNYTQIDTDYKFPTVYAAGPNYPNFRGTYGGSTKIPAGSINSALSGFPLYWDSVKIVNSTSYTDTIDGWGTVKTPVGTYNCLRQHRVEISTTTIYYNTSGGSYTQMPTSILGTQVLASNPIVDTTYNYYYLTKEAHGSVISFTYDSIHQPITATWSSLPPFPVANFSFTTGANGAVTFVDSSLYASTYSWSFGDGTANGTGVNANHTYSRDTFYIACLTVTNASGSSTKCDTVRITNIQSNTPPKAVNDTASETLPSPVTINVLANDINYIPADSVCITAVFGPAAADAVISGCSDIVFTGSAAGLDTFYYKSCDRVITTLCDTGMVVVRVSAAQVVPTSSFTFQHSNCSSGTFTSTATNATGLIWHFTELYVGFDTTIVNSSSIVIPNGYNNFNNVSYQVCLIAVNGTDSVQHCDTAYFGCTGISEIAASDYRIYPNPASDMIQLDFTHLDQTTLASLSEIVVYNVLGEKVKGLSISQTSISVKDLSNGVYMIGVLDKDQNRQILGKFEVLR
jgi:PKD repeat protein